MLALTFRMTSDTRIIPPLADTRIHSPCPLAFLSLLRAPTGTPQRADVCIYFFVCPFRPGTARRVRGDWQTAHSLPRWRAGRQLGLREGEGSGTPEESDSTGFPPATQQHQVPCLAPSQTRTRGKRKCFLSRVSSPRPKADARNRCSLAAGLQKGCGFPVSS